MQKPIESFEKLICNLSGKEDSDTIKELYQIAYNLRNGLKQMGVEPLADFEDWKFQKELNYSAEIHQGNVENEHLVTLRTLGFKYQHGNSIEIEPAYVIPIINDTESEELN